MYNTSWGVFLASPLSPPPPSLPPFPVPFPLPPPFSLSYPPRHTQTHICAHTIGDRHETREWEWRSGGEWVGLEHSLCVPCLPDETGGPGRCWGRGWGDRSRRTGWKPQHSPGMDMWAILTAECRLPCAPPEGTICLDPHTTCCSKKRKNTTSYISIIIIWALNTT